MRLVRSFLAALARLVRRFLIATAWLVVAALVAAGSAGIVGAVSAAPGSPGRAELTWAADGAARPGLGLALVGLRTLALDVESLGRSGRGALAALAAGDDGALAGAIADGTAEVAAIEAKAGDVGVTLERLPGFGPGRELRLAPALLAEHDAISIALTTTNGLGASWATLTAGSTTAGNLSHLLDTHDREVAHAARLGSTGAYRGALAALDVATAALGQATSLRDGIANSSDVSVLDEWIARNRALDTSLRDLYAALEASGGKVTDAVRAASVAERAAQQRLPPDTRGLRVIMAEIERGGLNQAVIAIEDARGRLGAAIDALDAGSR